MNDDFYRIRRLPPYVFAEVNAMKAAARAAGEDIVDLGMGTRVRRKNQPGVEHNAYTVGHGCFSPFNREQNNGAESVKI